MRIFIINAGGIFRYFAVILFTVAILIALAASYYDVVSVFSPNRELPIYSVERSDKKIAITFDCAWGADDIPRILNTLRNENVQATFFVVGQWAEKYPNIVELISKEGHDLGNHSYSHLRMGVLDESKIRDEIALCGKKLNSISSNNVELFRAPYGDYNNSVISIAKGLGYYTVQWDVDSLDWKPNISKDEIMNRVMRKVRSGSIILFHNDTTYTAEILPGIIAALKIRGYEFLPVSKLILKSNYTIDIEGRQKSNE